MVSCSASIKKTTHTNSVALSRVLPLSVQSPILHHVLLRGLVPAATYFYSVGAREKRRGSATWGESTAGPSVRLM